MSPRVTCVRSQHHATLKIQHVDFTPKKVFMWKHRGVDVQSFYSPQLPGINYIASVKVGNVGFPTAAAAAAEKICHLCPHSQHGRDQPASRHMAEVDWLTGCWLVSTVTDTPSYKYKRFNSKNHSGAVVSSPAGRAAPHHHHRRLNDGVGAGIGLLGHSGSRLGGWVTW